MTEKKTVEYRGGGVTLGLFFLILFVLKVNPGGHLDSVVENWSWWWITAPIWGPVLLVAGIFAVLGVTYLVAGWLDKRAAAKRRKERLERLQRNKFNPQQ